jgi:hypothetical protein
MSKFSRMSKKRKTAFMQLLHHTHDCPICFKGLTNAVFGGQTFEVCSVGEKLHDEAGLGPLKTPVESRQ